MTPLQVEESRHEIVRFSESERWWGSMVNSCLMDFDLRKGKGDSSRTLIGTLTTLPYGPGDKKQLKSQDVTAKLVRFDILRMVPKNILFCIKLT